MNCYLVIWPPDNTAPASVEEAFPENHAVIDGSVWAVAGKQRTCSEVCEALGIGRESGRRGVVTKVDNYYGLYDRALWEKIEAWREM